MSVINERPSRRPRDILFTPFANPRLALPNRILMSPMGRAHSPSGTPDVGYVDYFRRRFEGGVALAITGAAAVGHDLADYDGTGPHFFGAAPLAGWSTVLSAAHGAGGKLVPQLWHTGMERRTTAFARDAGAAAAIGPSGLSIDDLDHDRPPSGRSMDERDLAAVRDAFAVAARAALDGGFDGVEVHAGHGFLLDQFLWPRTNRRADAYGGDPAGRARFPAEVIAACRAAVGPDFPIFVRISQFKIGAYEARLEDSPEALGELLQPLADAGADLFNCSQREAWAPAFAGSPLNLAGWVKRLTGRPTIAVGSVGLSGLFTEEEAASPGESLPGVSLDHLDTLCAAMTRGEFDLLAIGRSLLADPDWPTKIREGRDATLRPIDLRALTMLD